MRITRSIQLIGATAFASAIRIFVYDHYTLASIAPRLPDTSARVWAAYFHISVSHYSNVEAEFPIEVLQASARSVLETRMPSVSVVRNPFEADVVLWLVWEYAVCLAANEPLLHWETLKRTVRTPCPTYLKLLDWLEATPRWQQRNGSDHALWIAHPDVIRNFSKVTHESVIITTEDRRHPKFRQNSSSIIIPYYVAREAYLTPRKPFHRSLLGFVGSTAVVNSGAPYTDFRRFRVDPMDLRRKLAEDMVRNCGVGECHLYVDMFLDRNDASSFQSAETIPQILKQSLFCPIPKGDSATSKRFFGAVLAGCIPIIISDYLAIPFDRFLDGGKFYIRISESEFMLPGFSLVNYTRLFTRDEVDVMQRRLLLVQSALSFSQVSGACHENVDRQQVSNSTYTCTSAETPDATDFIVYSLVDMFRFQHLHMK